MTGSSPDSRNRASLLERGAELHVVRGAVAGAEISRSRGTAVLSNRREPFLAPSAGDAHCCAERPAAIRTQFVTGFR
ncbi:Hypothetical predicted protein [Cloeon dipterum]|uniref:Uncharacterized protein n=1 Tax=Cloeon dipterum TaxID=197152 RepID=A0A8S1C2V8_9INSE|nr:Hypothetical predicted protein [Cloeon dipterum]